MNVRKGYCLTRELHSLVSLASYGNTRTSVCNPWNKALPGFKKGKLLCLKNLSKLIGIRLKHAVLTGPVMAEFCNLGSSHCVVLVSVN